MSGTVVDDVCDATVSNPVDLKLTTFTGVGYLWQPI